MIVSVHVTKTAGTSFGEALRRDFGERFLRNDEDWAGYRSPEAASRRVVNAARMRARRDELLKRYDVIHGHFVPEKFAGLFPRTDFVVFLRDPFQQTVSHYEFLHRIPHVDHPAVREFHQARMTIEEFVAWKAVANQQAQLIGGFALEDFTMIGMTEEFARSVALFNAMFGRCLSADVSQNANPDRAEAGYTIDPELRKLIAMHRAEDIDLYRRGQALFARQTSCRSIFVVGGTPAAPEFGVLDVPVVPAKEALVSEAIARYDLKSILDVGACWGVHGGYTYHALGRGKIDRAVVVDGDITSLTRERAEGDPRVQLHEGDIGDADFIDSLPPCDAAIVFDVLLHQVAPDWDEFLARYSRKVNHFVIWNPDWAGPGSSVRFVDRGLRWYLDNVGDEDAARISGWFERHDEICPWFGRPWRDVHYYWQWGIASADLIAAMHRLGFALDYFCNHGIWSDRYPNVQRNAYLFRRR